VIISTTEVATNISVHILQSLPHFCCLQLQQLGQVCRAEVHGTGRCRHQCCGQ